MSNSVTTSWVGATAPTIPASDAVTMQWVYEPEIIDGTEILLLSGPAGTTLAFAQTISDSGPFAILLGDSQDGELSPRGLWSGYQFDGTNLIFPLADLPGLTSAEAASDWREVLQAFLVSVNQYLNPQMIVERPRMFQVRLLDDWNYPHPTLGQVLRREVWFRLHVDIITRRVADEP